MIERQTFVGWINEDLGLSLGVADLDRDVDTLDEWDSVYLLRLLRLIEARAGYRLRAAQLMQIRTLGSVLDMVAEHA